MRAKILVLSLILIGSCLAQPPEMDGRMKKQNMDAIRIWKLTEVLELSEEQVVTFLPLVQIHERKLKEINGEIRVLAKEAYLLKEKGDVSQKQVDKFTKKYAAKHSEAQKIKSEFIQSLSGHLTPEQQLIYLGFESRFRSDLRDYMKKERKSMKKPSKYSEKRN